MTQLFPAPFQLVLLQQEEVEEEEEVVRRMPNALSNQLSSDRHHDQQGLPPNQIKVEDKSTAYGFGEAVVHNHNESVLDKWVSSEVRLMQRMMNSSPSTTSAAINKPTQISSREELQYDKSETTSSSATNHSIHTMNRMITTTASSSVRVCSDCSTTTTPLWRSGPLGPKSLCNACGIRQRKARRAAMEESSGATSGSVHHVTLSGSSISRKKNKSNKLKIDKFSLKLSKSGSSSSSGFGRVLINPQNEEQAAAILLMQLSCGLLHG